VLNAYLTAFFDYTKSQNTHNVIAYENFVKRPRVKTTPVKQDIETCSGFIMSEKP
jgi:hypothetical protein